MEYKMRKAVLLVFWFATLVVTGSTALPARAGLEPTWAQFVSSEHQKAKRLEARQHRKAKGLMRHQHRKQKEFFKRGWR